MPMNATCPNETMPELPEKVWIASTSTRAIRKLTTTRWSAGLNTPLASTVRASSGTPNSTMLRAARSSAVRRTVMCVPPAARAAPAA